MRKTEPGVSPFWDYIGMKEQIMEEGYAEVRLDITPNVLQRRGSVHGGVLASLIDASVGSAIRSMQSEEQAAATVDLKINYIRPAKGEYLIAKAKLVHRGGTLAVAQAEIFDSNEKLVAVGTATYIILKQK
jgi:uncharacterized protein (TIGR00369 family)